MDSNAQECRARGRSKTIPTQRPSCGNTGPTCGDGTMCEPSRPQENGQLTLSVEGFPASLSASRASRKRKRTSGGCGLSSHESFAHYDPDTHLWRTYQGFLFTEWETYSETWPRAGTMLSGQAYRRRLLVHHTYGGEYLFWPTPQASDGMAVGYCKTSIARKEQGHTRPSGGKIGLALKYDRRTEPFVVNGFPHPFLSEWLMGFPARWTALDASEMLLSRRSRKSSGK